MTLASVLRLFYHHAQAGSGALRDCRPLSCFLQPACARHSAYRQSLLVHSLHVSSCNRNNDLRRQRGASSASVSDAPASTAVEEELQWDEAEQELDPQQVLVLPAPSHSRVKTAEFVKSSTAVSQCPPSKHPEFAVIGRSNVGKSSLINMLTGKKALAQISKTPGQLTCYCLQYSPKFYRLENDAVMQAKQSASTTSSSTIPGFWLTSLDMGKCSDQHASGYTLTNEVHVCGKLPSSVTRALYRLVLSKQTFGSHAGMQSAQRTLVLNGTSSQKITCSTEPVWQTSFY